MLKPKFHFFFFIQLGLSLIILPCLFIQSSYEAKSYRSNKNVKTENMETAFFFIVRILSGSSFGLNKIVIIIRI